jgi:hypothetical protein
MTIQLRRNDERLSVELEVELGEPDAEDAADDVALITTRDGKSKRVRYKTLASAMRKLHKAIAAHLDDGLSLEIDGVAVGEPGPASFTPLPELEARVDDDPADDDGWIALGAAWREAGDPRGESIDAERSLQNLADVGEYVRRKARVEAARAVRNAQVWGSLEGDAYRLAASFREGLLEGLVFDHELGAPGPSTGELVAAVLASPFARFVREVRIANADGAEVAEAIAASPRAGRVTVLDG